MNIIKKMLRLIYRITNQDLKHAKSLGVNIGKGTRVFDCKFGTEPYLISIGENCTITGSTILTHDGTTWLFRDDKGRRFLYKKVEIKNNVFVGVNSTIMPGVVIEDNVIVAAGSLVNKSIPSGKIVAGNPAKIIGDFDDYKQKVIKHYKSELDWDLAKSKKENVLNLLDTNQKPFIH